MRGEPVWLKLLQRFGVQKFRKSQSVFKEIPHFQSLSAHEWGGNQFGWSFFKDVVCKNIENLKGFFKKYFTFNHFPPMNEGGTSLAGAAFKDLVFKNTGNLKGFFDKYFMKFIIFHHPPSKNKGGTNECFSYVFQIYRKVQRILRQKRFIFHRWPTRNGGYSIYLYNLSKIS